MQRMEISDNNFVLGGMLLKNTNMGEVAGQATRNN